MLNSMFVLTCLMGQPAPLDMTVYSPVYSNQSDHPWDALHKAFFVRTFTTGETYYHRLSFSVPWHSFKRLSSVDPEYQSLLKLFDRVDQLSPEEMEKAAPVRRLIFYRDLWTVFDSLKWMASKERGAELRRRIAQIMQRLELTDAEIDQLPDTLAAVQAEGRFPELPDREHADSPFFPTTLLNDNSDWIAISTYKKGPRGAPQHNDSVNQRSLFSIHVRLPEGRKAGEQFISAHPMEDSIQFPAGSELALLRRAVAANREGKLRVTRVVESLQLLVTPPAGVKSDGRIKFVLERSEFLSGKAGLIALESRTPVDAYSFESGGQWMMRLKEDVDGEALVLGRGKGHVGIPSMQHCAACHNMQNARFFANSSPFPVYKTTNADLTEAHQKSKENSEAWREYLQLRGNP